MSLAYANISAIPYHQQVNSLDKTVKCQNTPSVTYNAQIKAASMIDKQVEGGLDFK